VPQLLAGLGGEQQRVRVAIANQGSQRRHEEARDRDRPCSVILRGIRPQLAGDLDHVGADLDAPSVEVQVTDAQRRHLPESQARVGEEVDQRVMRRSALLRQSPYRLVREEPLFPDGLARQGDTPGDVAREAPVARPRA
jgi:hypothetical protein